MSFLVILSISVLDYFRLRYMNQRSRGYADLKLMLLVVILFGGDILSIITLCITCNDNKNRTLLCGRPFYSGLKKHNDELHDQIENRVT